ncbi:MAG: WecB/TagA/CpsF family glycosyltransferase [Lachnospiraceae bacterium]|nr:WecB/TagA/CpsF family glycosyltransferase [Lachnospiraceae bacterium]
MFDPEKKCRVLKTDIAVGDIRSAAGYVAEKRHDLAGEYICFSNVHTTVMAFKDDAYRQALSEAAIVFPDGHPIAKEQVHKGFREAERIAGPDFMKEMFERSRDGSISHFFYGSTQETLDALRSSLERDYPGMDIRGLYSPPFRKLSEEELSQDVERINASGADLVWIGLGAPKQELFMQKVHDRVNALMLGVGAGFAFHAKTAKRAPKVMQKLGLEWFYRLIQDPGRLFKRYLVTNTQFLWYTKVLKK